MFWLGLAVGAVVTVVLFTFGLAYLGDELGRWP